MAWNHKEFFERILAQSSNLTGFILDLSVVAWNHRDFFERVLARIDI